MKTKLQLLFITLVIFTGINHVAAQGTAFTYQGRLNNGTNPASGSYDFTFAVFNAATNGTQSGVTLTNTATAISNGLFVVALDFGGGVFNGTNYWLAIGVRTNGSGTFTALSPRQPIMPTPYAIYSENAGTAVAASGVVAGSVTGTSIANATVTAGNIASGQVVKSIDGLHDAVVLAGGANISVTSVGNNITVASTVSGGGGSTNGWSLAGNAGTVSTNFLGTTDNQNLQLKVDGQRALLLQPTYVTNTPNVIGGSSLNVVTGIGDTIAGGYQNAIDSDYGFIGGGTNNLINVASSMGFIGGGVDNLIGAFSAYAAIGGGQSNSIAGIVDTIAGGGGNVVANSYSSTIGGGYYNEITNGNDGIIAGGVQNLISGEEDSTIGGGIANTIFNSYNSTIGGGLGNTISNESGMFINSCAIGGGYQNTVGNNSATIPGGYVNEALGISSFACGSHAQALNDYSFVWNDSEYDYFASTGSGQYLIHASSGVGINMNNPQSALDVDGNIHTSGSLNADYSVVVGTNKVILYSNGNIQAENNITAENNIDGFEVNATFVYANTVYANGVALTSDRNAKENFKPVDNQEVLAKVSALPVTEWNYKRDNQGVLHIGPMAQDFQAAFGLDGLDDKHISVVDEGGVALAAIQGLNEKLEQQDKVKDTEIQTLKQQNDSLSERLTELETAVKSLAQQK